MGLHRAQCCRTPYRTPNHNRGCLQEEGPNQHGVELRLVVEDGEVEELEAQHATGVPRMKMRLAEPHVGLQLLVAMESSVS